MQTAHRPEPRTASVDDYSRFYFASDHCTIPVVPTPRLPSGPPQKRKKIDQQLDAQRTSETAEPAISDPSLENRSYGTCLLIGRSGTGKSTLLKHLVSRMPPRRLLYLVNVRSDECEEYSRNHRGGSSRVRQINLSGLREVASHSTIIIEDIISMKNSEQISLREGINYTAHHKSCKIFCVTHTVYKTGIFSMMPLFHYIIFTSSRANLPIIKQTLQRFSMTKEEVTSLLNLMDDTSSASAIKEPNKDLRSTYFFFDCAKMVLGYSRDLLKAGHTTLLDKPSSSSSLSLSSSAPLSKASPTARTQTVDTIKTSSTTEAADPSVLRHFGRFFATARQRQTAEGLLKMILHSESARRQFNCGDLSFAFSLREAPDKLSRDTKKKQKKISAVDYAHVLLNPTAVPSEEQKVLHRFLRSRISLPSAAIANLTLRNLDSQ